MSRHRLKPTTQKLLFSPVGILRDLIICALLFVIAWRCVPGILWMQLMVVVVGLPALLVLDYWLRQLELTKMMKEK